jgi:hypothetical protein
MALRAEAQLSGRSSAKRSPSRSPAASSPRARGVARSAPSADEPAASLRSRETTTFRSSSSSGCSGVGALSWTRLSVVGFVDLLTGTARPRSPPASDPYAPRRIRRDSSQRPPVFRATQEIFRRWEDPPRLARLLVRSSETAREPYRERAQADGFGDKPPQQTVTGVSRGLPELGPRQSFEGTRPPATPPGRVSRCGDPESSWQTTSFLSYPLCV